jgi:hypothetical protein
MPGLTGFSVQSELGKSIIELAQAGNFPNSQISVTTVRELQQIGVQIVASPGRGYHKTVITSLPLSDAEAIRISAVFRQQPNPFPIER